MGPGGLAVLALAAPFAAAVLTLAGPRKLAEFWGYAAAAVTLLAAAPLLPRVLGGDPVVADLLPLVPGLSLRLSVDALGLTFGLLAAGLWVVTSVYAGGYARADNLQHRPRFFAAFAASVGAAMGVAFAGNLLTFLVFYELLTLATYPLVVHKETSYAYAAGRRYLLFSLGSGLALTTAVVWTWRLTGSLEFVPGGFLAGQAGGAALSLLLLLFALGVAVKAAIMPLHAWLPAAMVAPTPVSALLHAVAVVKAGVFGVLRVTGYVFGPDTLGGIRGAPLLATAAMITIVAGSLIALRQDNLKRRLAYSTIVHLSYIVLGAALLAPLSFAGSVLHMVNHGLAKITLFFCAGAIYAATKKENISDFTGLGRRMPWTFGAFTVASLALVGIPGLSGFVGKLFLARGAVAIDDLVAAGVILGASLLTAAYLLPIVRIAFLPGPAAPDHEVREAPMAMVAPLVVTAVLVVLFGLVPAVLDIQFGLAVQAAAAVFGGAP